MQINRWVVPDGIIMITEELIDDEPELVLEDEQGIELSVNLIDDVELHDEDHDLPDLETLTAVATVKHVSDIPDLSFESEHEQTRLACELDNTSSDFELDITEREETPSTPPRGDSIHHSLLVTESETMLQNGPQSTPEANSSLNDDASDLDSLSINNISLASSNENPTPVKQEHQAVSVLPTDNTRLALLESAQLALNEQINELVTIMKKEHSRDASPTQSPSKQFTTAIYYAKHENNYYLAAKWFRKAALRGHAKAQFYLGMLFCKGDGVPRSFFHAYSWFSLAACQNVQEAVHARKKLEPALTSLEIQKSLQLAADRFDQIADLN
jgi:TPR repeat protein